MLVALGQTVDRRDLEAWVRQFGITHLVGGDYDDAVFAAYDLAGGRPQYVVIDRDFAVVEVTIDHPAAETLIVSLL